MLCSFTRTNYCERDYTCEFNLAIQVMDLRSQTQTEKIEAGEKIRENLEVFKASISNNL